MRSPATLADERADREKGAERQRILHVAALERDHRHADDRAEERREHERQQHQLPAEECADHREHLHVAEAHAFFVTEAEIDFAHQPQHAAAEHDAEERVEPAGRHEEAEEKPEHDAGQRDDVGQDAVLEIDDEQHDHRAGKQQALIQHRRLEQQECRQETRRRSTSSTIGYCSEIGAPHERQRPRSIRVAENRDVVVRLQRRRGSAGSATPARRATIRSGSRWMQTFRKLPTASAEHRDEDRRRTERHHGTGGAAFFSSGAAAGSVGSGDSVDSRATPHFAGLRGRAGTACRARIERHAAHEAGGDQLLPRLRTRARPAA